MKIGFIFLLKLLSNYRNTNDIDLNCPCCRQKIIIPDIKTINDINHLMSSKIKY